MEKPVYDLITGNVGKVRSPGDPDTQWSETHAVEIRRQAKEQLQSCPQLKVPKISNENITPKDSKAEQKTDDSLQKVRHVSNQGQEEVYQIDVKGNSKTLHVNMLTKYINRNADPQNVNHIEAIVISPVIDCDEDVEKVKPSAGNNKDVSSTANPELVTADRQMVTSFPNQCDHVLSDAPRNTYLVKHDIIAISNQTIRKKPHVVSFSLNQIIGENQLKAHPDKVKTIREAVVPSRKRKLRSFCGHLSFYKKLILIVFSIVVLFTYLLKTFSLHTNALRRGIGATLMQFDDESELKLPVAYARGN